MNKIENIYDLKNAVYEAIRMTGLRLTTGFDDIPVEFIWKDTSLYKVQDYGGDDPIVVWYFSRTKPGEPYTAKQVMAWAMDPSFGVYRFFMTSGCGPYFEVKSVTATYDGDSIIIELKGISRTRI